MEDADKYLVFHLTRRQTLLAKRFLEILEMNQLEHKTMVRRLKAAFPQDFHKFITAMDYFSDEKFARYRKQILDAFGDAERDNEKLLKELTIDFNFNK